jgi:phosphoglycolate phosphatase
MKSFLKKRSLNKNSSSAALRLAIFDCDGTLVDSAYSIISFMQVACKNLGFPLPKPIPIRRTVGLPIEDAITILFPHMEKNQVRALGEEFRQVFVKSRDRDKIHEPLYSGVDKTLSALNDAGWLLGVATGKSLRGLESTLSTHDLHHHFATLQTADLSNGKPDPAMLLKAVSDTGVEKERTVMIGDTSFDMEMARNAGTKAIGVTWGYHNVEDLVDAGAHCIVKTFSQIPEVIYNLLKDD